MAAPSAGTSATSVLSAPSASSPAFVSSAFSSAVVVVSSAAAGSSSATFSAATSASVSPSFSLTLSSFTGSFSSVLSFFRVNLKPTKRKIFLKPTSLASSCCCCFSSHTFSSAMEMSWPSAGSLSAFSPLAWGAVSSLVTPESMVSGVSSLCATPSGCPTVTEERRKDFLGVSHGNRVCWNHCVEHTTATVDPTWLFAQSFAGALSVCARQKQ